MCPCCLRQHAPVDASSVPATAFAASADKPFIESGSSGGGVPGEPEPGAAVRPPSTIGRGTALARAAAPVTREQAYILLSDILRDVLGCDPASLDDATPVEEVPGWDSIGQIGVLAAAEIRFGVEIRAVEAERLTRIGEVVDLILKKQPCLP